MHKIQMTRSMLAEGMLYLNGSPLSLDDYKFMRPVYDSEHPSIVLHTSRQISKSTTLANIMVVNSVMIPHFRTLYISPTVDQTKIFSGDRVATVMEETPYIKKHLLSTNLPQNVFTKQFKNKSKLYLRYALQSADRLRGISSDAVYYDECYAPNMQVLTYYGWKFFSELNEKSILATRSKNGRLQFQCPTRILTKQFSGKLLEFRHRSFKLTVTPGHNLLISQELNTGYYRNPATKGWNLVTADKASNKNFKMTSVARFDGTSSSIVKVGDVCFNVEPFMAFMGWYLSEGCYAKDSNRISISQQEGENAIEIRECLSALGIEHKEHLNKKSSVINFYFHDANLHKYLSQLGNSFDKYIPENLLNEVNSLPILLDSLYKGDAIRRDVSINGYGELNTASEKLADTVQRAWLYLGRKATIRQITEKTGTVMYRVRPLQLSYQIFWNIQKDKRIHKIQYDGPVYCATVPNGTLIVRDKDEKTAVVSGNCQDLLPEIIPVANETFSRSMYKWNMFSGTPKTSTTTLAKLWRSSTKNEWMTKCTHPGCKKWNYLDNENLGDFGVICRYCKNPLDTRNGVWVQTGEDAAIHQGFRISILMFANAPWVDWQRDIVDYRKEHSEGIFFNEKLGLEYDSGAKPVTLAEIKACCTGGPMLQTPDAITASKPTYIGLDYGPTNSKKSNTVLSIVQNEGKKIRVVFAKKYLGPEADYSFIHRDIPKQFYKWKVALIGADYGLGEAPNSEIRKAVGFERLIAYQHVANQKDRSMWNKKMPAFTLNRTQVMTDYFQMIKHREIIFPRWEDFAPFGGDILNINTEYDEERGKVRYTNNDPDDFFQALVYGSETAIRHKATSAAVY